MDADPTPAARGRRRTTRRALLGLVAGVVLLPTAVVALLRSGGDEPAPSPSGPVAVPRYPVGFSVGELVGPDADVVAERLASVVAAGANSIRFDIAWSTVHPDAGDGRDWAPVDRVVDAARSLGLHCVAVLGYTPGWARDPAADSFAGRPREADEFAGFVTEVVQRYGDRIDTWEVWNEPNASFWEPYADPAGYADLLRASASAIRELQPNSTVLTGGTAPALSVDGVSWSPQDFLHALYEAGAAEFFDAVAVHPYCFPALPGEDHVWSGWTQMLAVRDVMVGWGDDAKEVWATEAGSPTDGPGPEATLTDRRYADSPDHGDEEFQSATVQSLFDRWADLPWLRGVHWYSLVDLAGSEDDAGDPVDNTGSYGLVRSDGTAKPARSVWLSAVQRFSGAGRSSSAPTSPA